MTSPRRLLCLGWKDGGRGCGCSGGLSNLLSTKLCVQLPRGSKYLIMKEFWSTNPQYIWLLSHEVSGPSGPCILWRLWKSSAGSETSSSGGCQQSQTQRAPCIVMVHTWAIKSWYGIRRSFGPEPLQGALAAPILRGSEALNRGDTRHHGW